VNKSNLTGESAALHVTIKGVEEGNIKFDLGISGVYGSYSYVYCLGIAKLLQTHPELMRQSLDDVAKAQQMENALLETNGSIYLN
jgi:hypothetical protein